LGASIEDTQTLGQRVEAWTPEIMSGIWHQDLIGLLVQTEMEEEDLGLILVVTDLTSMFNIKGIFNLTIPLAMPKK